MFPLCSPRLILTRSPQISGQNKSEAREPEGLVKISYGIVASSLFKRAGNSNKEIFLNCENKISSQEDEDSKRKEAERKAQEEADRKQAELDEKLKKDEEERLARKRRLDEIMARTRGAGNKSANSTPKKVKKKPQQQQPKFGSVKKHPTFVNKQLK